MHAETEKQRKTTHTHHIKPKHMGGTDDPENLIELTVEEHAQAHLDLYNTHGKKEDLAAYLLLSGQLKEGFMELHQLGASKGGKVAGAKNRESGHIQRISANQSAELRSENGKKGAATGKRLEVNAFFDPKLRTEISRKGGLAQGKINAESDHLTKIAQNYWADIRSGKKQRKKQIWVYSEELQISKTIKEGEDIPEGFIKGRKIKW